MNKGEFRLSPASEKILATVRPDLQKVIRRAAELTTVPFAVVSGGRTAEQQAALYRIGRRGISGEKPITWTLKSNHMSMAAVDVSAVDAHGKPNNHDPKTWSTKYYKPIADVVLAAGEELGIPMRWPLWQKGDFGHLELVPPYKPLIAHQEPQEPRTAILEQKVNPSQARDLSRPEQAMSFLESYGWKRHQAAAIVGQGIWESGGKDHIHTTALGDNGTAHGGYQWRGDRYIGRDGLLAYTRRTFPGRSSTDPEVQLSFVNWELTEGNEKRAGRLLKAATNVEEATEAFIGYLRPVHFKWDNPRAGHGFARRLEHAQKLINEIPIHLEDTPSVSTDVLPAEPSPTPGRVVLLHKKEDL